MTISIGGGFVIGLLAFGVSSFALLPAAANKSQGTALNNRPAISVPAGLKNEAKVLIDGKWPSVLSVCPGLSKYSTSLTFDGIDENFDYAPQEAQRVDVKFTIHNDSGEIPKNYISAGHRCFFGISRDGSTALIAKRPCQSICLDKDMTHNDKEKWLRLSEQHSPIYKWNPGGAQ